MKETTMITSCTLYINVIEPAFNTSLVLGSIQDSLIIAKIRFLDNKPAQQSLDQYKCYFNIDLGSGVVLHQS